MTPSCGLRAFGREALRLRMLSACRQLAELGIATLRFDLSGTGDSGTSGDLQQWQRRRPPLSRLPCLTGARQAVILGARAGALLAAPAAASSNAAAVILAEPILTGEDMVNDLERRQKIKDMMTGATSSEAEPPTEDAAERDFGGFVVSDTMLQQIRQADLAASLPDTAPIHVLRVSGARTPASWQPLLTAAKPSSEQPPSLLTALLGTARIL